MCLDFCVNILRPIKLYSKEGGVAELVACSLWNQKTLRVWISAQANKLIRAFTIVDWGIWSDICSSHYNTLRSACIISLLTKFCSLQISKLDQYVLIPHLTINIHKNRCTTTPYPRFTGFHFAQNCRRLSHCFKIISSITKPSLILCNCLKP